MEKRFSTALPGKKEFRKLEFGHIPGETDPVLYLPFYRIAAEIKGIDLCSYAELVRIANLPGVVQKGME